MIKGENITKKFEVGSRERKSTVRWILDCFSESVSREITVLDDLSIHCRKGTVTGLVGRNGSGKTTLLKILAGIIPSDEGTVEVEGDLTSVLDLGLGFHPELTGRENCYLYGSLLGMPRQDMEGLIEDIFSTAEIPGFKHTKLKYYSSGMEARLGFSVMIHVDPDVLLLDEIFAVGDKDFRPFCEEKLYEFREEGKTILLASHETDILRSYCDRILCLHDGKIVKRGNPSSVLSFYDSL
jgi:ABC-type polysaccharide/polyol phosphate transport system ATPase subunit